ncbi:DUF1120 domain-containing protein [Stenotrophomonas maltophilia]|uniref:DUF1120 domain-containing protein n=1 Tax=Stenotrophomonas maltophilia TaxID=40324 RepID=UPI0015589719|nr:DUF1120 domain-containing protein [Stenotrophomonas maltophilia]
MKSIPRALLGCALIGCTGSALAQSATADLAVKGTISPSACIASVSGGGDFGNGIVDTSRLNEDAPTILPKLSKTFTVTCPAPTLFAFLAIDSRDGSSTVNDHQAFGLGMNSGEKVGMTWVGFQDLQVDGGAGQLLMSADDGSTWVVPGYKRLSTYMLAGFAPVSDSVPSPITNLTGTLVNETTIAPKNALTTTDDIAIDGSVLMEMKYL